MSNPTSGDILKKTFEYLEEVLDEENHHNNTTGIAERFNEKDSSSNEAKNKGSRTVQNNCCSD